MKDLIEQLKMINKKDIIRWKIYRILKVYF